MPIKAYDTPADAIDDGKLAFCPQCWQSDELTVRVGEPFVTPEGQTLRALVTYCRHCLCAAETYHVGRVDGVIYSGTWLDWERAGHTVGKLAERRRAARERRR